MRVKRSPDVAIAPRDWIDEIVVERLVKGVHPGPRHPSHAERVAAARVLADRGFGSTQIAARLRVSGALAAQLYREATLHDDSLAVA
jgi:hypothetical protein